MYSECGSPSSARSVRGRHRLRTPIFCFRADVVEPEAAIGVRTPRSPYAWLKSTAHELEIKDRCRRVKARIKGSYRNGCSCSHHRQSHLSADFSYDPLSYALNFDDDVRADEDEPHLSFTARLPASPERKNETAPVGFVRVC